MATNQGFICIAPDSTSLFNEYLARWIYLHKEYIQQLGSGSTFLEVTKSAFKALPLPLPPLHEQRAIAAYLDTETPRIDALIAKTERLTALLREKRTALISQAVTKGLDAAAAMKDSGVAWLGEIPAHWDVRRLKTVIRRVVSGSWGSESDEDEDNLTRCIVIRGTDFQYAMIGSLASAPRRFISRPDAASKCLSAGNIIIEISGGGETQATGRALLITPELAGLTDIPILCTNFAKALKINNDVVEPIFFWLWWTSLYDLGRPFIYEKKTTGIRNFQYADFVANEAIVLPPLREQRAIADRLDTETARIDALIAKSDRLIALLREKRSALISAAVTGKLAVSSVSSVVKQ